ncbi:hypothetical protein ACFZAR_36355 [Streptomyces sp. NPDC008222]|uniref:hypothetical protein n=1 Tax=Streptomyces sp. NPDC008222 TaxID=3364820 RepID=UPI0036F0CDDC
MYSTAEDLQAMAHFINRYGLHTGPQFAALGPAAPMDISAVAYIVAERCAPPPEFFTDEDASLRLIECSAGAMAAIRAISEVLDPGACETEIAPGLYVPDYIEHVSHWAATPAPFSSAPPTVSEVVGCILRAANTVAIHTPTGSAA